MSEERKAKKGKVAPPPAPRKMTAQEVMELQELHRAASIWQFIGAQVKANSALVPRGQQFAEEAAAVGRLIANVKAQWISAKLLELGYPPDAKCSLDLMTGEVKQEQQA